jgi:hypothetical protein
LYWKLQSVNQTEELVVGSKEFTPTETTTKDYDTRELDVRDRNRGSLQSKCLENPLFSRIHSLTLAFVDKGVVRISYITGEEGHPSDFLKIKKANISKTMWFHTRAEYILPFRTRMDKNGIKTTTSGLQYKGLRP